MITIILYVLLGVVLDRLVWAAFKKKEKTVSVVVMSGERKQADELFNKQLGGKIPIDYLRVIKHANNTTEFQLTIKKP